MKTHHVEIEIYKGVCAYQKYLLEILDTESLILHVTLKKNLRLHRWLQWLERKIEVWWLLLDLEKLCYYYYYSYYYSLLFLLLFSEWQLQYPFQLLFLQLPQLLLFLLSSCRELHGHAEIWVRTRGWEGTYRAGGVTIIHQHSLWDTPRITRKDLKSESQQ